MEYRVSGISAFLLITALHVGAIGLPQEKITLSEKNASLSYILQQINKQTGYQYFFVEQWASEANKIDIDVSNATLETVLKICFKNQPFTYEIVRKTIVIKKKANSIPVIIPSQPSLLINIHGRAFDEAEKPVVGVTVTVKGTKRATSTDDAGGFSFTTVNADAKLEFTGANIETAELAVNGEAEHTIKLIKRVSGLDEVQVIAYGTTTKRLNTGDVTTVKAADIEKQPVSNPLLALEGRVPGLNITQSTGLPGSAVTVRIRGQNSISNGNDPLYIIDGVPYTSQNYMPSLTTILGNGNTTSGGQFTSGSPFNYLNPADIESIEILKDADATAIYGTRGANGVVLITTKKGKIGQTKIDINVQNGFGKVADKMKLLNTRQYLDMRYEAFKNDGTTPNSKIDYDLTLWDTARQTDWQDELIGGTAKYTDVQASVSGGNTNTQFFIGTGYNKQTTVFQGNFNDQKGSVHFNINNISPNQKFRIQLSGLYVVDDNHLSGFDLTAQALRMAPDAPSLYNSDGSINWAVNDAGVSTWPEYNPAAMLLLKYKTRTDNLVSNAILSYHVLPGLDLKSSFGYTNAQTNEVQTIPLSFSPPSGRPYFQRRASFSDNNIHSWIVEPQLNFSKPLSSGVLSVLVGMTIQQNASTGQILNASGFNSDLVLEDIKSASSVTVASSVNNIYKYNAGFGKLNYNWKDKYLVSLTARRDGSSRFGPASQFHNFGAIGAAWIFSKEQFMLRSLPFISFGKLRGSFGTTGSDQVGDYTFMDLYDPLSVGVPYQGAVGFRSTRIFTPDLSWEETRKLESGIELGFFKDRLLFNASFYRNRSSNQLEGYTLPAIAGFTTVEKNLPAVVQNRGWEFELKTVNIRSKNFIWTSSLNLTMNRNVLITGAPGLSAYYQAKIGHSLSSRYVYRSLGVDPFTGLYQVADSYGKPTATPNISTDATILLSFDSRFYGGFENCIDYKGFQIDFLFQFADQPHALNYKYNFIPGSFNGALGSNQPVEILNRWQQPGDVKPVQRFSQNASTYPSGDNALKSDQVYLDTYLIRLRNLSLSWQLPAKWQKDMHLHIARIYVHGQNLLTITDNTGLDPETGSTLLPPLRIFTGGIQVTL